MAVALWNNMEFSNFDEFMKAMDRLRDLGESKRASKKGKTPARKHSSAGSRAAKQLIAKARRLDKAAEKLLKISQSKERAYESRHAATKAKTKSKRSRNRDPKS